MTAEGRDDADAPPAGLADLREQVYAEGRPKEHFDRYHEHARRNSPGLLYDVLRVLWSPTAWIVFRTRSTGSEHVPPSGPAILAPNHASFMDHFFVGVPIRRKVRFMAKSQLFKGPLAWFISTGGAFPVRRGGRDDDTFVTAEAILARGGSIVMYCEGGRSRTGRVGERARPGIGRLALETGAPVVPIAIHGSARLRNWRRLELPRITIAYGEAIRYEPIAAPTRDQQRAVADEILAEIRVLHDGLDRRAGGRRSAAGPSAD